VLGLSAMMTLCWLLVILITPGAEVLYCQRSGTNAACRAQPPMDPRPLIHAIVDHQESEVRDDATIMLLEWRPPWSKAPSSRR
jgi:hypothetical protein